MSLSVGFKAAKSKTGFMAYKDLKPQYHPSGMLLSLLTYFLSFNVFPPSMAQ